MLNIFNIFKKKSWGNIINVNDGVEIFKNKYDNESPLTLYGLSLYTNKAINKRAESTSQIKFVIKKNGEIIENSQTQEIINLLNRPNKIFSGVEFWRLYQIYKDVCGEAYILIESKKEGVFSPKTVNALHLLHPYRVKPIFDEITGQYARFEYQTNTGTIIYSPEQIIRDFTPDPDSILKPCSLLKAGLKNIKTGIELEDYQSRVLENGGKVESVFKFKAPLTKQQVTDLKDSYKNNYSEAKRSGLPLFIGGDTDYIRLSLTPEEMGYIQSKGMNLNDICLMTGVPKVLLANVDDIKYSNSEESRAVYMRDTIDPLMKSLCTKLDWSIVPMEYDLSYIDPTPENREEKRKDLETADKINAMTINEKRLALGLDEVKGGDDILIPFNLVPLGTEQQPAEKGLVKKKTENHPLRDYNNRRVYHKNYIKRADNEEKIMLKALKQYFKEQEDRVLENMGVKGFKKEVEQFFNEELEIELSVKKFLPIITDILRRSGTNTFEDFKLSTTIGSWLQNKVEIFSRKINDTTFNQLKVQFVESIENGEDRDKLVKRIRDTYGDISESRAKIIARTEVQGAMQKGTFEGYKQSGVTIKIWTAVLDSKTRDTHALLDGEEKPIDSPFSNGLMFPGEPGGKASEVINCRCTV